MPTSTWSISQVRWTVIRAHSQSTAPPDPCRDGVGGVLVLFALTVLAAEARPDDHGVRALDVGWLETALADVPLKVSYQHGLEETLLEVDSGRASAAVLIRPVSVTEMERTAREGLLMPPKSTFFTPKLKTGFVIRSLSE